MVQFLENKKMIFHFMDVDYFLLLLLKKLIFFSKTSKKWRAPGSRQVFHMCPIRLIDLFHSYVSEHLSTCTHGVSELIDGIFVNVKFPRYNPLVIFDGRDETTLC